MDSFPGLPACVRCPPQRGMPTACRQSQRAPPGAIDETTGDTHVSGADGAGDDELIVNADLTQRCGPADQVVGEQGALQPCRVGVKAAGGDVVESGTFFQIADREL